MDNTNQQTNNQMMDDEIRKKLLHIKKLYNEFLEKMEEIKHHEHEIVKELRKIIEEKRLEEIRDKLNKINDEE